MYSDNSLSLEWENEIQFLLCGSNKYEKEAKCDM